MAFALLSLSSPPQQALGAEITSSTDETSCLYLELKQHTVGLDDDENAEVHRRAAHSLYMLQILPLVVLFSFS